MYSYLFLTKTIEQNEFVNSMMANNGGGYSQPLCHFDGLYMNKPIKVIYDDTSCGGFGSRIYIYVKYDNKEYEYSYNSMDYGYTHEENNIPRGVYNFLKRWGVL